MPALLYPFGATVGGCPYAVTVYLDDPHHPASSPSSGEVPFSSILGEEEKSGRRPPCVVFPSPTLGEGARRVKLRTWYTVNNHDMVYTQIVLPEVSAEG